MNDQERRDADYIRRIAEALERIADLMEKRESIDDTDLSFTGERPADAPAWLTEQNIGPLADELMAFVDREQAPEKAWLDRGLLAEFWDSKGLESRHDLPEKHQRWIDKVEALVEKKREARELKELQREEASIPNLVTACFRWASERELKHLNQADVGAILKVDTPKVRPSTVRSVWQQVNLQLKGGG